MDLEPLVGEPGGLVPVGDDQAAERVGRGQRHEVDGLERTAPEIGVDADPAAARGRGRRLLGRLAVAGAEDGDAVPAGERAGAIALPLLLADRTR